MLVPKRLFLHLVYSGRVSFPFGESNRKPGPATTTVAFEFRPLRHSPRRDAPGDAVGFSAKRDLAFAYWSRMTEEADAPSWEELADRTSDAEWNEFWRGYPYTHNVRALCREYAKQELTAELPEFNAKLAAELAEELERLEGGEAEMQELLGNAPPTAQDAGAGEPAAMLPLAAQAGSVQQVVGDGELGAAGRPALPPTGAAGGTSSAPGPVEDVSQPAEGGPKLAKGAAKANTIYLELDPSTGEATVEIKIIVNLRRR